MRYTVLSMMKGKNIILRGVAAALAFWIFESFIHSQLMHDNTFLAQIITHNTHELWMRLLLLIVFFAFCIHCQLNANKQAHTESVLKKSEEKYRAVFEHTGESIVLCDPVTMAILEFSDSAYANLGYSKEEFSKLSMSEIEIIESEDEFRKNLDTINKMGGGIYETKHRSKNGDIRNVVVNSSFISVGDEKIIQSIWRDITAYKEMMKALKESEAKYSTIINMANDGVVIVKNRMFDYVNEAFTSITGYSRDELTGMIFLDVVAEAQKDVVLERYNLRMAGKPVPAVYETTILTKQKTVRHVEVSASKIEINGFPVDLVLFRNITDRILIEENLRESEERFRLAAESMSDHIYEWDVLTGRLDWFGDIDGALGFAPGTFPRTLDAWISRIHPDDQDRLKDSIKRHQASDEPIYEEYQIKHEDGTFRYWIDRGMPVPGPNGRPIKWVGACIDVTRQKRIENDLVKSEEKYRLIADNVHDGIWIMSLDQRFTYFSPSIEKIIGFTHEEIMNMTLKDRLAPASYELAVKTLTKELENEKSGNMDRDRSVTMEIEQYHKDGYTQWVEVTASFLRDEDGKPNAIIGVTRDIAERKEAEKEMHALQERFLKVFDTSPVATAVSILSSGKYIEANQSFYELTGYKREDIVNRTSKELSIWATPNERDKVIDILSRDGSTRNLEVAIQTASGAVKDCLFSADILELGDEPHLISMAVDITARKRAEKTLEAERDKLQAILAGIGDGIAIIDRDYTIETHNYQVYNFFGNAKQKKCYKVFFGKTEPCENCPFHLSDKGKKIHSYEFIAAGGKHFDVSLSFFYDVDRQVKIVALLKDVTDRKKIEGESIRIDRLAAIGELASGVAHEINNPITGVINYAELLKDDLAEQGMDADIPEKIIREGERIARIVKNLLSFARARKEKFAKVMLKNIFNDSLHLLQKQMAKDGIKVSVNISDGILPVRAKAQEIQQIFLNIVSNSRYALNQKFPDIDKRKIIEINCETLHIRDRSYVRTIVYDCGEGIREELMDKICNPFFTTKPPGKGTGLGLSICHGIIENHDGRLDFESVEGEYTKVIIDLPVFDDEESDVI